MNEIEKLEFGTAPQFSLAEKKSLLTGLLRDGIWRLELFTRSARTTFLTCTLAVNTGTKPFESNQLNSSDQVSSNIVYVFSTLDTQWMTLGLEDIISAERV